MNENDNLIRKPFESKRTQEEMDNDKFEVISLKLNKADRDLLNELRQKLRQPKDGTCIKTCLQIAKAQVILDQKTNIILETIFNNERRNQRTNNQTFE